VKPDPAALEAPPPAAAASESSSGGGKGGKGKGGQRQGGGGRGRGGKGGGKGGKGGRGRGERFVVPTGQAFFTGGSGALPVASSSASGSYHIGGMSSQVKSITLQHSYELYGIVTLVNFLFLQVIPMPTAQQESKRKRLYSLVITFVVSS
jgi:hypothetical protein